MNTGVWLTDTASYSIAAHNTLLGGNNVVENMGSNNEVGTNVQQ